MSHAWTGGEEAALRRSGWFTLGLFALLSLVCYIDRFILGALLTPLKSALRLTDEQLGRLNVVFVVAYILIVPLAGFLGDRYRRKGFVFVSLVLWSAATLGSGCAKTYRTLLVWRALVGFGEGVYSSLSLSWIADSFSPGRRQMAFSVIMSMSQLAAWVAYHFGGKVAAESGWGHAFVIAGIPGIVLAFAVPLLREPRPGASEPEPLALRAKPGLPEIRRLLVEPRYVLYLAGYTVRMLAVGGLFFWGAVYLHREYGIANKDATSFIGAAYLLTGIPGIYVGGHVAARLARKLVGAYALWLGLGEALSGVAVLLVLVFQPLLPAAKALILAQMFFAGSSWGVINPLLFEIAPVRLRSVGVSVALAVSTAGSTFLASQVIGLVSDQVGIRKALSLVPVGYFAAAVLWFVLSARQRKMVPSHERVGSLPAIAGGSLVDVVEPLAPSGG
jgi:MFS transporter, Spinster family, sphingosine-1-phosphate transporter